jgi:hypothetical protein
LEGTESHDAAASPRVVVAHRRRGARAFRAEPHRPDPVAWLSNGKPITVIEAAKILDLAPSQLRRHITAGRVRAEAITSLLCLLDRPVVDWWSGSFAEPGPVPSGGRQPRQPRQPRQRRRPK